jgi:hypothetical protein
MYAQEPLEIAIPAVYQNLITNCHLGDLGLIGKPTRLLAITSVLVRTTGILTSMKTTVAGTVASRVEVEIRRKDTTFSYPRRLTYLLGIVCRNWVDLC